ncbi:gas vesicle protein [Streptomyces sp. L-9-10]|uniref:gas vesicle protein GvpO n=1 Tax=unclassified Streptomyces TaxID=2593676 RepID=UPI00101D830F|nr:gas vesicle protein [Streptomyces sp. L-9-10]
MAEQPRTRPRSTSTAARRHASPGHGPEGAARAARERLESLISHRTEGVSGVRRTDDGWCVVVDVLELARIPDTTSLLASYEVHVDQDGELLEYRRVRRYRRGAADE